MFTGIIENTADVKNINIKDETIILDIENKFLDDIKIGDSIAVNGVCLTVKKLFNNIFQTDIMPVTFRNTNLSKLKMNDKVNIERSLTIRQRFDGHIVTGHVDGIVIITNKIKEQNSINFTFNYNHELSNCLVKKGSVSLDGISLTVTEVTNNTFNVSLIPHTLNNTTLGNKNIGDLVNIETDILAKYIQKNINNINFQIKKDFIT